MQQLCVCLSTITKKTAIASVHRQGGCLFWQLNSVFLHEQRYESMLSGKMLQASRLVSSCASATVRLHQCNMVGEHGRPTRTIPCAISQVNPVTVGLDDRHPYVRRTAVMGVLKIWHMNPDIVESQGMLQHVQTLLGQDSDPQVMANGLTLLMQVRVSFS